MKLINPNFDIKSLFGDISVSGNEIVNREGHSKSVPSKGRLRVHKLLNLFFKKINNFSNFLVLYFRQYFSFK